MQANSTLNLSYSFASHLVESGLLDESVALGSLQEAEKEKTSYIHFLIKKKILTELQIATVTAEYFGLPLCDISAYNPELIPVKLFDLEIVKKRIALPIYVKKGYLYLAIVDPANENLYDSRFLTGLDVRLLVTFESQLIQVFNKISNTVIISSIERDINAENSSYAGTEYEEVDVYDAESAPVINYVNKILFDGINKGASDIHFEKYENAFRIRYRMFGDLHCIESPPIKLANFILARLKIMSNLDITEHRIPQDGRISVTAGNKKTVEFRVSICPMVFGEKIVLRILDFSRFFLSIDEIGMKTDDRNRLAKALDKPQGMILVTGPTGSGKTVTLYSSLTYLNKEDINIQTVEDPVEIPIKGINQVHVNIKVGLTFSTALRSFLRQDPDVIMVGEIRDLETAEIAIKAAQTGHLVLSTLHTNSASETITRLIGMGITTYNLSSCLILIVAQRLVKVLCNVCKQLETLTEEALLQEGFKPEELQDLKIYKAGSCNSCLDGFTGRTGIYEVLSVTEELNNLILSGANVYQISDLAKKQGMKTLREAGLDKVKTGVTSLLEVNKITS